MCFNNVTRLYDSIYLRLPCEPGKKAACLREGDYEAGHAITHVQTHVQSTVRVWYIPYAYTRTVQPYAYGIENHTVRVRYVPYAYGTKYAYGIQQCHGI